MCKGDKAGGRWTVTESNCHITELETLAAFFALKSFCLSMTNCHINIYIDNTTAVSYINAWVGLILWNVIRLHVKFAPGASREISG